MTDLHGRHDWTLFDAGGRRIYAELVDQWTAQVQPGPAGGTLSIPIRTGRQVWRACEFGVGREPAEVTDLQLLAAIEADRQRRLAKHRADSSATAATDEPQS